MAEQPVLKQIVENIIDSNNVLVTVSANPSVDELSAALGITLLINKLDKHATAVFSGKVPPAIDFLNPHKTFENTVDSLRDFIIALDKNKADHLRYKVVDDMVKIFITPYRTTINEKDLDFSQGDYNVETVLAIGVKSAEDLDHALEAHGRILHDATVAAVSLGEETKLGGLEWADRSASSYSEMLFSLAEVIRSNKKLIDEQIATAFLTGIVAATERFSNNKTSAHVMTIAAQLMADGANQQLIAAKLEEEHEIPAQSKKDADEGDLKEGRSAKIDKSEPAPAKKQEAAEDDGSIGALTISHMPKGDIDEVAEQIAAKQSSEAAQHAESLAKSASPGREADKEAEEDRLASKLAASEASRSGIPSVADIQRDIARATDGVTEASEVPMASPLVDSAPTENAMPGFEPIALDKWSGHPDREAGAPSFGGTLNATAEQAQEDSEAARDSDKNKTILSHGGSFTETPPAFQAPLNSVIAAAQAQNDPQVRDIFAEGPETAPTGHAEKIQPPVQAAPTLADIDSQNRNIAETPNTAEAAFSNVPTQPPLPPLPPMPDFSTLPPLPGEVQASPSAPATQVPDTLGNVLPPVSNEAPSLAQAPSNSDPSQFHIPGQ